MIHLCSHVQEFQELPAEDSLDGEEVYVFKVQVTVR